MATRLVSLSKILLAAVAVIVVQTSGIRSANAESAPAGDDALFERLDANEDGKISVNEVPPEHKRLFTRLVRKGDRNTDAALSRDEFLAALVPSRPEKTIEEKQPTNFPQAEAVRYLLLTLDTSPDGEIEAGEVPEDMQTVFNQMADRFDTNDNDALERYELSRSFQGLGQIAARYVARERIDVASELKKLEKSQGTAVNRFEEQPKPFIQTLGDPEQARKAFARLDTNKDKQIDPAEIPEPLQRQIERFMRLADRDGDGKLSEREFLAGADRASRMMRRPRPEIPLDEGAMPDRKSQRNKAADSSQP